MGQAELVPVNELRRRLALVTTPLETKTVEGNAQRLRDLYVLANDVVAANEYAEIAIDAVKRETDRLVSRVRANAGAFRREQVAVAVVEQLGHVLVGLVDVGTDSAAVAGPQ